VGRRPDPRRTPATPGEAGAITAVCPRGTSTATKLTRSCNQAWPGLVGQCVQTCQHLAAFSPRDGVDSN
jgi:hypothetical protein